MANGSIAKQLKLYISYSNTKQKFFLYDNHKSIFGECDFGHKLVAKFRHSNPCPNLPLGTLSIELPFILALISCILYIWIMLARISIQNPDHVDTDSDPVFRIMLIRIPIQLWIMLIGVPIQLRIMLIRILIPYFGFWSLSGSATLVLKIFFSCSRIGTLFGHSSLSGDLKNRPLSNASILKI